MYWIVVLAVAIIVILAAIAAYYVWLLIRQQQQQKQQLQELEEQREAQRQRINTSIQVLASGAIQGQLTLTEASIRIGVLLESLAIDDETKHEYQAFFILAEKTAHIPILDAWKDLSTKQKLQFDQQREDLEREYGDFVLDAATRIMDKKF
ncbi:DUF2489 domain-containing protein [Halioxenophilus sp. WMMB6]|uniref:DUF2489 domain-containing protein n=1 Tax=Halioxenophilus sp. WMMB6 TaxID=3073815 RepID=UPI00295F1E9D|nr:DUF2489 domain-containing protein [Halioxenophilus sp. WMMB6]